MFASKSIKIYFHLPVLKMAKYIIFHQDNQINKSYVGFFSQIRVIE